jgi:hypothetical protein
VSASDLPVALFGRGFSPRPRFGPRRGLFGGRARRSRGFVRRVLRALAFAYILHLLFSHGFVSVLIWLLVATLVASSLPCGR